VFSLNVPLPSEVAALASRLARDLPAADRRERGSRTLLAKRLAGTNRETYHRLEARAREALVGQPAFAVRVDGVDCFAEPTSGSAPVVYLAVESPGLQALHERLCEAFDPVPELEGPDYTPHVTIARGGSMAAAEALAEREIDPIEWDVTELAFYQADRDVRAGRVSLPA